MKFTKLFLNKKNIALGMAFAGCIAYSNQTNAQCYSESYGTVEAGTWSTPAEIPVGPYNGCENLNGETTTTNFYNHDHGFFSRYDGTGTVTWSRSLTGLDPSKTYEVWYNIYPLNSHRRLLTMDYNLAGLTGSYTTGTINGIPNQTLGSFNVTGKTNLNFVANLHCDAYQSCEPAQEVKLALIVREVIKTVVNAPTTLMGPFGGSVVLLNTCPQTGVNLANALTGSFPAGFTTEWHTGTPLSDANKVADPSNVPSGIYAATCRKNTGDKCYSPISSLVYTATFPCGGGGFGGGGFGRPAENGISFNANTGNGNGEMFVKGAEELHLKYGTPVLTEGDANNIYITMDNTGKYVAVSRTPGVYKFNVPLLPPTQMEGEVPNVPLTVTVKTGIAGANEEQAYIMPNPVSGNNFSFVFVNNQTDNMSLNLQMTDVNGRTVYSSTENITKGTNKVQIQTSGLAKGIYYLNYNNAASKISGKLKVAID